MKTGSKLLLTLSLITVCSCTNVVRIDLTLNAPKYENDKQFITFGYASPTDGTYTVDGVTYNTGTDFRTKERYIEYKEAGLNTMMIQRTNAYNGEKWESSQTKKCMDLCVEAGIERCIITDERLYRLTEKTGTIFGTGTDLFADQDALKSFVADCMKDYAQHEVFYGVMLVDEPRYTYFDHIGPIYKAIKELYPNCYIQENLLPYRSTSLDILARYCENGANMDGKVAYSKYVNDFIDATGTEKVLMDSYPILFNGTSFMSTKHEDYPLLNDHIAGLQILSDICKERGLEFNAVAQTASWKNNGSFKTAKQNMATMQWQLNAYMGFGVKKLGYFTYWRKQANSTTGEWFNDGTSFITNDGNKTDLYYVMQDIHGEIQDFAPTMLSFEYQKSKTIKNGAMYYSTGYLGENTDSVSFEKLRAVNVPQQRVCLATELFDKNTQNYMYMLMNVLNPYWEADGTDLTTTYEMDFGSDYNAASVYYRGVQTLKPIKNGKISITLDPGYAVYVIPYKA